MSQAHNDEATIEQLKDERNYLIDRHGEIKYGEGDDERAELVQERIDEVEAELERLHN